MNAQQLRDRQAPLKSQYLETPGSAIAEMTASGIVDVAGQTCVLSSPRQPDVPAGLHPMAGGQGDQLCAGDMLLESLVACAGVTFAAVATALETGIEQASVTATGVMDFRGTLGVDRETPVGFKQIELEIDVPGKHDPDRLAKLLKLTERYCVVYQTLSGGSAAILSTINSTDDSAPAG